MDVGSGSEERRRKIPGGSGWTIEETGGGKSQKSF
jgi:hypothetical protein